MMPILGFMKYRATFQKLDLKASGLPAIALAHARQAGQFVPLAAALTLSISYVTSPNRPKSVVKNFLRFCQTYCFKLTDTY
jgi:hypothetical protein